MDRSISQVEFRWESGSGGAKEEDMRLIKQILVRYWKRKLCSLVLNLYCQHVRINGGDANLVSTSWAKLSSWCAQMNHESSLLQVRRGKLSTIQAPHQCSPGSPSKRAGLRTLGQDPRSRSMKVSCTFRTYRTGLTGASRAQLQWEQKNGEEGR